MHTSMVCCLGVLVHLDMLHWGSVGSSLSKVMLLGLPESVNKNKAPLLFLSRFWFHASLLGVLWPWGVDLALFLSDLI